jgi:hypothetical protein
MYNERHHHRRKNSAIAFSIHPAARILNALFPHFGHCSNHSPGRSASLKGATVFFQPHLPHTRVKGLGGIGIAVLLSSQ